MGPGIDAKHIYVGITYTVDAAAANKALGVNVSSGDEQADARAVVADINAHGGVAGRTLVPVFHGYDAESTQSRATQDEAACADFTQDHKVFAVAGVGLSDALTACLWKAGVIQASAGQTIGPDRQVFTRYPGFFDLTSLTQDRMMADLVRTLTRLRYFAPWDTAAAAPGGIAPVKVGVLSLDDPSWERPLTHVLLPALKRAGHPVDPRDVYRVHVNDGYGDAGATVADIQSAELRFRSDGITHVVSLDATGGLTLFFEDAAKAQRYYPRLGIDSGASLQTLYDGGSYTSKQLTGALGLGWLPPFDLPAGRGDRYLGQAKTDCLRVIKQRTGQSFADAAAATTALGYCDTLRLIAEAADRAGRVLNATTATAAVERLGTRFPTASLPAAFFGPGRHDAAQVGYDMGWGSDCSCMRYLAPGHRIP
jgi:ABC-type branched-subunit amino acid transport system substrate-binding protein